MIRQAQTYMVGAMSGATLIAIAIAAFVLLVSAQVFQNWPVASLGGGDNGGAVEVSDARATSSVAAAKAASSGPGAGERGEAARNRATNLSADGRRDAATVTGEPTVTAAPKVPTESGGPASSQPGSSPASSPANSGSGAGPAPEPVSSGSGSGSGAGSGSGSKSSGSSTSGQLTEPVNGTVNGVDEALLGGALGESGVTGVTEGLVNGVAGPESVVGKTVDGVTGALGGLLGGPR